jgi:hypothetical protein
MLLSTDGTLLAATSNGDPKSQVRFFSLIPEILEFDEKHSLDLKIQTFPGLFLQSPTLQGSKGTYSRNWMQKSLVFECSSFWTVASNLTVKWSSLDGLIICYNLKSKPTSNASFLMNCLIVWHSNSHDCFIYKNLSLKWSRLVYQSCFQMV